MHKNINQRMIQSIKGQLIHQKFNVFSADTDDQAADLIIRNITQDLTPQYIEICILSRTDEYNTDIQLPIKTDKNIFYYYILHSSGIGKIWLLRSDELLKLRAEGLDARDTSPYLVKSFDRLTKPELNLKEFTEQR